VTKKKKRGRDSGNEKSNSLEGILRGGGNEGGTWGAQRELEYWGKGFPPANQETKKRSGGKSLPQTEASHGNGRAADVSSGGDRHLKKCLGRVGKTIPHPIKGKQVRAESMKSRGQWKT